jgi:hypothetical protein
MLLEQHDLNTDTRGGAPMPDVAADPFRGDHAPDQTQAMNSVILEICRTQGPEAAAVFAKHMLGQPNSMAGGRSLANVDQFSAAVSDGHRQQTFHSGMLDTTKVVVKWNTDSKQVILEALEGYFGEGGVLYSGIYLAQLTGVFTISDCQSENECDDFRKRNKQLLTFFKTQLKGSKFATLCSNAPEQDYVDVRDERGRVVQQMAQSALGVFVYEAILRAKGRKTVAEAMKFEDEVKTVKMKKSESLSDFQIRWHSAVAEENMNLDERFQIGGERLCRYFRNALLPEFENAKMSMVQQFQSKPELENDWIQYVEAMLPLESEMAPRVGVFQANSGSPAAGGAGEPSTGKDNKCPKCKKNGFNPNHRPEWCWQGLFGEARAAKQKAYDEYKQKKYGGDYIQKKHGGGEPSGNRPWTRAQPAVNSAGLQQQMSQHFKGMSLEVQRAVVQKLHTEVTERGLDRLEKTQLDLDNQKRGLAAAVKLDADAVQITVTDMDTGKAWSLDDFYRQVSEKHQAGTVANGKLLGGTGISVSAVGLDVSVASSLRPEVPASSHAIDQTCNVDSGTEIAIFVEDDDDEKTVFDPAFEIMLPPGKYVISGIGGDQCPIVSLAPAQLVVESETGDRMVMTVGQAAKVRGAKKNLINPNMLMWDKATAERVETGLNHCGKYGTISDECTGVVIPLVRAGIIGEGTLWNLKFAPMFRRPCGKDCVPIQATSVSAENEVPPSKRDRLRRILDLRQRQNQSAKELAKPSEPTGMSLLDTALQGRLGHALRSQQSGGLANTALGDGVMRKLRGSGRFVQEVSMDALGQSQMQDELHDMLMLAEAADEDMFESEEDRQNF